MSNFENGNILSVLQKNCNRPFETKKILKYLIQLKYSNNVRMKDELKMKIFIGASKLFIKAINNFSSLTQNISNEKMLHTPEDVASECYLVMSNCIDNLQIQNVKKFYFYLNTSLNRRMFRLYERNYKKHFDVVNNTEDNIIKMRNKGYNHHFDMSEIDLNDFNELELEIIKFKFTGDKLSNFLKKEHIPSTQYYEILEGIKVKLLERYK